MPSGLLQVDRSQVAGPVEYLGVVCVVLVTRQPITRFYVVNIADEAIPFTGVIGMSNVVDPANTEGFHLTYLPRYLLSTDDEIKKSDDYFKESFVAGIKRMFPEFNDNDIVGVHVNRAIKVQPLQVLGYSSLVPGVATRDSRVHVLNTSQFVNATLNNNEVVGAVNQFYETFKDQVEQHG
jgi:protoporphyrinogen oxidase